MRIMITGGGTGGHTSPAIAIIEELQKRDPRLVILWAGRRGGVEQRLCERHSFPFRGLPVEGWPRQARLRRLWVAVKLAYSTVRAAWLVRKFRPQLVLGVGGYVSVPVMWAAQKMGIPTVLHEQNKRLGMANRLLAKAATRILLSYPDTLGDFPQDRAIVVGNPVRAGFRTPPDRDAAVRAIGFDPDRPVVLVSGGSQGARSLNQAMAHVVRAKTEPPVQYIWMCGQHGLAGAKEAAQAAKVPVQVFPFIEDMVTACAAADLIVSRAGASSTAEIAVMGKAAILVPFPHATDNHQEENARAFEQAGAAVVLLDPDCTGPRLAAEIDALVAAPARRAEMEQAAQTLAKSLAAETVVEQILQIGFEIE